jgi:Flagellar basal body P-ring biosynthesis protein
MTMRSFLCLLAGWLLSAPVLAAPGFEPLPRIAAAALSALDLGQGGQATLDPNLRLQRCTQALSTRITAAQTVEVACPSAGWRLFVPVVVSNTRPVLVLARPLAPGRRSVPRTCSRCRDRPLARRTRCWWIRPRPLAGLPAPAAGRQCAQPVRPAPGTAGAPRADGGSVIQRGSVQVRVAARALRDGALGDSITVENLSSRKIVHGTVMAAGTVAVR